MMNDKELNEFTKSVIKEANLETPSFDFVKSVMGKIEVESLKNVETVYKPLISKPVWGLIFLSVIAICLLIIFQSSSSSSLLQIDMTFFDKIPFFEFINLIHVSETLAYSMVLFAAFVIVQMVVIKNIINKQYSN